MKRFITLASIALLLFLVPSITVTLSQFKEQADATDTAVVNVSIQGVNAVDINPINFTWANLPVPRNYTESGPKAFQVENIGSTNITHIWASTTNPTSNPFGTGVATNYDAGQFVVLINSSSSSYEWVLYPNTVFFNESVPTYIVNKPSGWNNGGLFTRIRTAGWESDEGEEYFVFVVNGTQNCTDGTVYIGKDPHTKTKTGSIDFSDPANYVSFGLTSTNDKKWGYKGPIGDYGSINNYIDKYYVLVPYDCKNITLIGWSRRYDTTAGIDIGYYLFTGTLEPGAALDYLISVVIPYGVAQGDVKTGTLTIYATTA